MSSDIITLLLLDKTSSNKVIVLKEINRCDSSFVTSCVLNHCIRNRMGVLVVSTHNSLQHYQNVGLRMGYNFQRYVDTGYAEFYNLGEDCINNLLNDKDLPDLSLIYHEIKKKILSMHYRHNTVSVILDGITHLFDLKYSLQQVNTFCKELIKFVTSYNNSFIVCQCSEANDEDVTSVMSNLLCHKAHTVLDIENLPSGLSADVSGHLTIKYPGLKFASEHLYTMDIKPSKYLFKLFDRGVKLFAPGTV